MRARDGLVYTGDLGRWDDTGRLILEGRADEMVIIGRANVYPSRVEEVMADIRGVAEVAVVGVPDERDAQRLVAYVVPRPGAKLTGEYLVEWAGEALSRFAVLDVPG